MKRLLLSIAFLFVSACASVPDTSSIRVRGEGYNENDALQNAFKKAIEHETGVLVLSERESQHYNIVKNDIFAYSSGYVDNFRVVSSSRIDNRIHLVVDVTVSNSKIKNRILAQSQSANPFDGTRHNVQYNSYLQQRQSGDKLLDQVFTTYVEKGFDIKQGPYRIDLDQNRNAILKIPVEFKWNNNFLIALSDALDNVKDTKNFYDVHNGYVSVNIKKPRDLIGSLSIYRFVDMSAIRKLNGLLISNKPYIKVKLLDNNNQVIQESCLDPNIFLDSRKGEEFFIIRDTNTIINGYVEAKGTILVTVTPDRKHLFKSMTNVELSVASYNKC